MRQHMVRNKNKSSFTCSQPTSSKFMVPAAPHTAVQFALCSEPLNPTRKSSEGIGNGAPSHLTSLTCSFSICRKNAKKRTDIMRQHMVRNKNKSSFTCSQPTSSKFMVPAAPHTAVQFALCSEPLNPTRQKLAGYW